MTTTDQDVILPISSVWDSTSALGKPQKPSLAFPAYKPLVAGKTHLHSYWKGNGNWVSYTPPIEWDELPDNVSYGYDHWVGRFLPDKSYVHTLSNDGKFLFLRAILPVSDQHHQPFTHRRLVNDRCRQRFANLRLLPNDQHRQRFHHQHLHRYFRHLICQPQRLLRVRLHHL
jgi:hypothetical protein